MFVEGSATVSVSTHISDSVRADGLKWIPHPSPEHIRSCPIFTIE